MNDDYLIPESEYVELVITKVYEEDTTRPEIVEALCGMYPPNIVLPAQAFKKYGIDPEEAQTFIMKHMDSFNLKNAISQLQHIEKAEPEEEPGAE